MPNAFRGSFFHCLADPGEHAADPADSTSVVESEAHRPHAGSEDEPTESTGEQIQSGEEMGTSADQIGPWFRPTDANGVMGFVMARTRTMKK